MKEKYIYGTALLIIMSAADATAQEVLLSNDFGTDPGSLAQATAGWGVADIDGDGHTWHPYQSDAFEDLGFTGIVDASASFATNDQNNTTFLLPLNVLGSPEIDLSGYASIQLTFKVGALLYGEDAMAYEGFIVTGTFIDFFSANFSGAVYENGSEDITIDLTPYAGQAVTLMRMHTMDTYGIGYLLLDDIIVTGTTTAGTTEIIRPAISVYPNPATYSITAMGLPDGTKVELYGISGQKLFTAEADTTGTIDISWLPAGTYVIRTPYGSKKIIKSQ